MHNAYYVGIIIQYFTFTPNYVFKTIYNVTISVKEILTAHQKLRRIFITLILM